MDVDPEASVQPRIRDIICLTLDFSHFILVPIDISKRSIFVVSFSDFETDQIAFRRGMKHVFGLKSIILIDGTMTADTSHFSIDQLFSGEIGTVEYFESTRKASQLADELEWFQFRSLLANLFVTNLARSKRTKSLNFELRLSKNLSNKLVDFLGQPLCTFPEGHQHLVEFMTKDILQTHRVKHRKIGFQIQDVSILFPLHCSHSFMDV